MIKQFKNYDKWKLSCPDDEYEEQERRKKRKEYLEEQADYLRDRQKDEPNN